MRVYHTFRGFPKWLCGKELPAEQEMWVPSLGGGNPQEKEMATHSSILAWEILWTEEPGSPWGHKRVRHNLAIKDTHIILFSFPPLSRHSGSYRFGCYTSGVYVGALAQEVEFP